MQFIRAGSGYNTAFHNWSAADAIRMVGELVSCPERMPVEGMQSIPLALAADVTSRDGAVHLRHRLVSLRVPAQTGDDAHELVFATPAGLRTIRARRVVLAMPPRAIALVPDISVLRDGPVAAALDTVTPRAMGKLFLAHEVPWTKPPGLPDRAVTDLPARQLQRFSPPAGADDESGGLLTMAYFDDPDRGVWAGLRQLEQPGSGGGYATLDPDGPTSRELRRQIAVVYGLDAPLPVPRSVAFMDWRDDPFAGAWHSWNAGVRSADARRRALQAVPGTALHIVGEAWSTNQAWAEGALETVEAALELIDPDRAA